MIHSNKTNGYPRLHDEHGTELNFPPNMRIDVSNEDGVYASVFTDENSNVYKIDALFATIVYKEDASSTIIPKIGQGISQLELHNDGSVITHHNDGSILESESVSVNLNGDTEIINPRSLL